LIWRHSHNLTKMTVVQLRGRKWAERGRKPAQSGPQAGHRGSDKWPQMPAFCGVPAVRGALKKNVPTGATGGGKFTRR
jgi:hypothetical protein